MEILKIRHGLWTAKQGNTNVTYGTKKSVEIFVRKHGPSACPTCPHGKGFNCKTCWQATK